MNATTPKEKDIPPAAWLDRIDSPEDLRRLDTEQLNRLAEEIRERIIRTVARTGGHLASSLGTVELTLAIHYVFNTPQDKLVWDVGHQAYAHKIITGRRDRFATLRQQGGVSGFPRREESPYDAFNVGHSGTSISAAAGIAEAQCLNRQPGKVIVVIGDGSMTSGIAFEAFNWAGDRKKNLIIILNDNEMSISPNVGAMSAYLSRLMTGQTVTKLKAEIKGFLKTIPGIGEQMVKFTRQIEESLKAFIVPGVLFEELGFTYVGPLQGHRLDRLIRTLQNVREMEGPILVHIVTTKGKGYAFAETEPLKFHGISAFDVETGRPLAVADSPPTYTEVFGRTLVRLAREDARIVAVTAAMCEGTGLTGFAREYPHRFFDVGIAEQHAVTFAAGLATEGLIPVVAIYSTFLQRAYDQIIHDVCLQNLPVVFALDRGGLVGEDGATHQGMFDLSYLRAIPNLVVMAPRDENELQRMLQTAVSCGRPSAVRYPRGKAVGVPLEAPCRALDIGRGEIVAEGGDLAIIAVGTMVQPALAAAARLQQEGVSARVIDARYVKPLDEALLCAAAADTGRVLVVEENVLMGGFGSAVLEFFARDGIGPVRVHRLGIADEFVEHATQAQQRRRYGLDEDGIVAAARRLMNAASPP